VKFALGLFEILTDESREIRAPRGSRESGATGGGRSFVL
jgi:hypothetical protein